MIGCYRPFVSYLKQMVSDVMTLHCVIHRQHLAAKHLSSALNESLQCHHCCCFGSCVRKRTRNITDFGLPKFGDSTTSESVLSFFADEDVALRDILELRQADIAYLADLCEKFNAMNLQLQVGNLNLMKTKSVMSAFVSKLALYKRNTSRGELCQFPKLAERKQCPGPFDQDIEVYCEHLEMLHEHLRGRFHDILSMVVIDPFASVEDAELHLQEELVDLQSNDELKPRLCQGYEAFWLQKQIPIQYPRLRRVVKRLLIAFRSLSLVERYFGVVTDLLTKKRNRLQVVNRGDLQLRMTGIEPDFEKLARLHGRHDSS
ncbi:hypothetical protein M513_13916 [Trichuris suis]|uniref:HAT C-terminal dimerisation domain-containing protein n=1 Tax=Trichuris suis TaxID=68888 RepID=A0A085LJR2_9BILA|nr:hypothetical protein M513_13916 [Trichuris suis]